MNTPVDVMYNSFLIRLELTPKQLMILNHHYEHAKELEKDEIERAFCKGMFDPDDEDDEVWGSEASLNYYENRFDL